jgi:hypothetical protein
MPQSPNSPKAGKDTDTEGCLSLPEIMTPHYKLFTVVVIRLTQTVAADPLTRNHIGQVKTKYIFIPLISQDAKLGSIWTTNLPFGR